MNRNQQQRIAIVTDSTADLPRDLIEEFAIRVIPQILIMGDRTWLDGVDIDSPTFYDLLQSSPHFPSSSQPSVVTFQETFTELAQEADGIVAVLVSEELSGTLNSAQIAAANLPNIPIEIIDSRSVSLQLGFIVLAAAQAAAAGGNLESVANAARALVGKVQVYFVVDTLEYLHRGGRIGSATKLLGSALDLKPVLRIKNGAVEPLTRVRTRRKALATLLDLIQEQVVDKDRVHLAVLHVADPEGAAHVAQQIEARFKPVELITSECGPVIGTHAGPGTVGAAFYVEEG
jgi:DegV family protein with EDD domain